MKTLLPLVLVWLIAFPLDAAQTLTYGPDSKPIAGVKITMTESDGTVTILTTDSNGQVTLPTTSNTYTLSASLAETGEDPVDLLDAIWILQHSGELRTLTTEQLKAADVSGDDEVDLLDAIYILQHSGELRTLNPSLIFLDTAAGNLLSATTFNATDTPSISVVRTGDVDQGFDPTAITDHAPILIGTTTLSIAENETAVSTLVGTDADADTLTYSITGGADQSLFSIHSSTGLLSFVTPADYENPTDNEGDNTYDVEITVSDGVNTSSQSILVSVMDISENPVIANLASSISVAENQTSVVTVSASDPNGDTLTYSLSGTDTASFSISASGVITFNATPDYETQINYSITVNVTDGTNTTSQALTITVTDVDDTGPLFTLASSASVAENQISAITPTVIDSDPLTFSLSGVDASLFNINASSGVINFKTEPDYENPGDSDQDNNFEITVTAVKATASRMSASSTDASSTIQVTNIDEDLINLIFSTTDGTASTAPTINIDLQIDELTFASSVSILTWKVDGVQTWSSATKVDSLNWNLSLALDPSAASGTYAVRSVKINKTDGTQISFVQSALDDKGFTTSSEIYNAQSDSNAPTLTSVNSITVENNDGDPNTNIILTIKVGVNDVEGGLQKAFSYVEGPGGEITGDWGSLNSAKDEVTFSFSLDPRTGSGTYKISDIRLYDIAGNSNLINTTEIASLGFQNNFEINNPISDDTAPNIIALSFTPSVDASDNDRKQITINLTTDDQVSDIRDIYIRLISPANANIDKYIMDKGRPFTTTVNGNNYSHTISLPLEYPAGEYTVSYIFVNDQALNNRRYEASDLTALFLPTSVTFD